MPALDSSIQVRSCGGVAAAAAAKKIIQRWAFCGGKKAFIELAAGKLFTRAILVLLLRGRGGLPLVVESVVRFAEIIDRVAICCSIKWETM